MDSLLLPVGLLGAFLLAIAATRMKPSTRLVIAAVLCVPQIFYKAPVPLAGAWILVIGLSAILESTKKVERLRSATFGIAILLLIAMLLSLMWAIDDREGQGKTLRMAMFAILLWYALRVGRESRSSLDKAVIWSAPLLMAHAIITIIFRVSPDIEEAFLKSSAGALLVGGSAADLFSGIVALRNNVLDPEKAGGLFVNGNTASMFMGVGGVACLLVWQRTKRRSMLLASLVTFAGVIGTGSKTGLALVIMLPLAAVLLDRLSRRGYGVFIPLLALFFATWVVSGGAEATLNQLFPVYAEKSALSLDSRQQIWSTAWLLFKENPMLGLGFGGWLATASQYLGTTRYPPHNTVLQAWADSGGIAALLTIVFIFVALATAYRAMTAQTTDRGRRSAALCLVGVAWPLIHGMGDNTTIFGDPHSMALMAVMIGYSVSYLRQPEHKRPDVNAGRAPSNELQGVVS
ncbi:O-antigen ligase family protein [Nocardioides sp.]|uniref:O-antigen ligase family protein n=1 Tax=Nocardioides sp. TaxID=35761 RepID=UPI00351550E2